MTEAPNHIEDLVRQLYGLSAVQRELSQHALAQLGSYGFRALAEVAVEGSMRVSAIAQRLGVDLSVASRQVAALAADGHVVRRPDPEDGRAQIIELTPSGRQALRAAHERMVAAFGHVLAHWSPDEVATLASGLARLREDFLNSSALAVAGSETQKGVIG